MHGGLGVPPKALLIVGLPIETMTTREIAQKIRVKTATAKYYLCYLRQAGLIDAYAKPSQRSDTKARANRSNRYRAQMVRAAEARAAERDVRLSQAEDLRTEIPLSVWQVYAKTIPQEEMARWFRLG